MRVVFCAYDKKGQDGKLVGRLVENMPKCEKPSSVIFEIKSKIRNAYGCYNIKPEKYIIKVYNKHTKKRTIIGYAYRNEHYGCFDFDIFNDLISRIFIGTESDLDADDDFSFSYDHNHIEEYYLPVYCYRHTPSLKDGINEIIRQLTNEYSNGKVTAYEDIEEAEESGNRMLCDDDCYGIMRLSFSPQNSTKMVYENESIELDALHSENINILWKKDKKEREKERAIRSLQNIGILDENGDIVDAYKDIIVKR